MSEKREAKTAIKISMDAYPAWICPSEMWWQILDALEPTEGVHERIESLPSALKSRLREYYRSMPPVCYFDYLSQAEPGDRRAQLCSKIIEWCEQAFDSSQASPD